VKTLVSVFLLIILVGPVYSGVGAWTSTNGPNGGNFSSLVILAAHDNVIFAGGDMLQPLQQNSRLFRSVNAGSSWREVMTSDGRSLFGHVRVDPLQPDRIMLNSPFFGIFSSTDTGATWQNVTSSEGGFTDMEFNTQNANNLYAVLSTGGGPAPFFFSADGGKTWSRKSVVSRHQRLAGADLVVSGANPNTLYIQLGDGLVYQSMNQGNTWRLRSNGLPGLEQGIRGLAIDPKNSQVLYSAGYEGVYKTTNGAGNWFSTGCECHVRQIAIDPSNSSVLYAVGRGDDPLAKQAVKSTDSGKTWSRLNLPHFQTFPYTAIAVDPANPKTLLASSQFRGIFKSTNGGDSWRLSTAGARLDMSGLAADVNRPGHLFAYGGYVTFETNNSGGKWNWVTPLDPFGIKDLRVHPKDSNVIVGAYEHCDSCSNLVVSTDGGKTWQARKSPVDPCGLHSILMDPIQSGTIYTFCSGYLQDIAKSTDLGQTWKVHKFPLRNEEVIYSVAVDHVLGKNIYVTTLCGEECPGLPGNARIYKSTNAGNGWADITWGATKHGLPQTDVYEHVETDPKNASVVYVVGAGLSKSTDAGLTWFHTDNFRGGAISIDPWNPQHLVSTGFYLDTVVASNDGGKTWMPFINGLSRFETVGDIIFSPWTPKVLFAATSDGVKTYTEP
jgi:photosystem II stability/assembly factor-like uncharacterized protein